MKKGQAQQGFTLLESLVVLGITVLMLSFPSWTIGPAFKRLEEEWFFSDLESRLEAMQALAIVNGNRSRVDMFISSRQINFQNIGAGHLPLNGRMDLPAHMAFADTGTYGFYFKGGTGNVSEALTIRFLSNGNPRNMAIQLGSGRYVLYE